MVKLPDLCHKTELDAFLRASRSDSPPAFLTLLSYLLLLALRRAFLRAPFLIFDFEPLDFRGLFPPFSLRDFSEVLPSLFEDEPSPVTLPSPGETHIFSMFFIGRVPAGQQFVTRGILPSPPSPEQFYRHCFEGYRHS